VQQVFDKRERIAVYLEEKEYKWVVLQSGGAGRVSSWAREMLIKGMLNDGGEPRRVDESLGVKIPSQGGIERQEHIPITTRAETSAAMPGPPTKSGKACIHGTAKGDHCWRCQGKAVVE
jgi:hypothetical protein